MKCFFIIGSSGSGKSSIIPQLQNLLGNDWVVYDFDSIGVPKNADKQWRQQNTERWLAQIAKEKKNVCLAGQMVLGEIVACPSAKQFSNINSIFLDCSDQERIKRLVKRNTYGVDQHMLNWSSWLRMHYQDPQWATHVITDDCWTDLELDQWLSLQSWDLRCINKYIDTTLRSIEKVAQEVARIITNARSITTEDLGLPLEYQLLPDFFDEHEDDQDTVKKNTFIKTVLQEYNAKTVLDMTCGTGSQVLYLATYGFQVTGSDFSPALLEIARKKAKKLNRNIDFIDGDMRTLKAGNFDAVMTIFNAIGHLSKTDFEQALSTIYDNLHTGGIYIFDILNAQAMNEVAVANFAYHRHVKTGARQMLKMQCSTFDPSTNLLTSYDMHMVQQYAKKPENYTNTFSLQLYSAQEINDLLKKNGFKTLKQTDMQGELLISTSSLSIVTVAQKI